MAVLGAVAVVVGVAVAAGIAVAVAAGEDEVGLVEVASAPSP
jgi:hypothetical protein